MIWGMMQKIVLPAIYLVGLANAVYYALQSAFRIRLFAIEEYGRVIHEFDPYFNYRATEYLYANGWAKFAQWFDYMVWYPLGRPVGTTIYPGMQVSSVLIKNFILPDWSINDICCFVPVWFGVLATAATGLLAYECSIGSYKETTTTTKNNHHYQPQTFSSIINDIPLVGHLYRFTVLPFVNILLDLLERFTGSTWGLARHPGVSTLYSSPALECGVAASLFMSVVPAHIMRSVGGGYDNESIAMFAMTFTFYAWVRSLRGTDRPHYAWSIVAGLSYFYMVAAWGGYVFVLNLIGVHASLLVLVGRYSTKLHRAYTIFYALGTALATRVPVVGLTPLKSLEQMGPLLAFGAFQLIELCEIQKRRLKLSRKDTWLLRVAVFGCVGVVAAGVAYVLAQAGYFGPISSRVRGLFVKHTKTGNPLVDSVAEHQPGNPNAYYQYLDVLYDIAPFGFGLVGLFYYNDASSFLLVYGVAAYYFSLRMVRLILLTAPIASCLGGIAIGHLMAWCVGAVLDERPSLLFSLALEEEEDSKTEDSKTEDSKTEDSKNTSNGRKNKKDIKSKKELAEEQKKKKKEETTKPDTTEKMNTVKLAQTIVVKLIRLAIVAYLVKEGQPRAKQFRDKCFELAKALSHPTIIQKGRLQNGQEVMVDDYREAYWWVRDHTPKSARIIAWWDYGYQITGISNRTTIADGNTWNHEHIALLGRTLTSSVKEGHRIARHLGDYVLVWAGGGGDDLAKSPHMRRIANSVYRFLCPRDPTCRSFGFTGQGQPSATMRESLLFNLCLHGTTPGVEVDKNRFRMVFQSKHGKVRIFKVLSVSSESKKWVANRDNRICDAPGSWFCRGQYPPALEKILKEKKDFKQLEDFNVQGDDSDYTKRYLENLNDPDKARREALRGDKEKKKSVKPEGERKRIKKLSQDDIDVLNNPEAWGNNAATTSAWEAIHNNDIKAFRDMLLENPEVAHMRSQDGRGPMWWAHEYKRPQVIKLLTRLGVSDQLQDVHGTRPIDL